MTGQPPQWKRIPRYSIRPKAWLEILRRKQAGKPPKDRSEAKP